MAGTLVKDKVKQLVQEKAVLEPFRGTYRLILHSPDVSPLYRSGQRQPLPYVEKPIGFMGNIE
jgi:hypothetical protein